MAGWERGGAGGVGVSEGLEQTFVFMLNEIFFFNLCLSLRTLSSLEKLISSIGPTAAHMTGQAQDFRIAVLT